MVGSQRTSTRGVPRSGFKMRMRQAGLKYRSERWKRGAKSTTSKEVPSSTSKVVTRTQVFRTYSCVDVNDSTGRTENRPPLSASSSAANTGEESKRRRQHQAAD